MLIFVCTWCYSWLWNDLSIRCCWTLIDLLLNFRVWSIIGLVIIITQVLSILLGSWNIVITDLMRQFSIHKRWRVNSIFVLLWWCLEVIAHIRFPNLLAWSLIEGLKSFIIEITYTSINASLFLIISVYIWKSNKISLMIFLSKEIAEEGSFDF